MLDYSIFRDMLLIHKLNGNYFIEIFVYVSTGSFMCINSLEMSYNSKYMVLTICMLFASSMNHKHIQSIKNRPIVTHSTGYPGESKCQHK